MKRGTGTRCTGFWVLREDGLFICTRIPDGCIKETQTDVGPGYLHKLGDDWKPPAGRPSGGPPPGKSAKGKVWGSPGEFQKSWAYREGMKVIYQPWVYQDASGGPVGAVVRIDPIIGGALPSEMQDKTYRPMRYLPPEGNQRVGRWQVGDPPAPLPLYRLPEVLADPDAVVYVVEGEKVADRGFKAGMVCTTSMHGSNAPQKTDWEPLAAREVVILPDNDAVDPKTGKRAGQEYARRVTELIGKGPIT